MKKSQFNVGFSFSSIFAYVLFKQVFKVFEVWKEGEIVFWYAIFFVFIVVTAKFMNKSEEKMSKESTIAGDPVEYKTKDKLRLTQKFQ